jgi:hypothetical protein
MADAVIEANQGLQMGSYEEASAEVSVEIE